MNRLEKVQHKLIEANLDCLIISDINNIRYITGFTGSEAWLLISENASFIAVDFRYKEQVKIEVANCRPLVIQTDISKWLPEIVYHACKNRLGFESNNISYLNYQKIKDVLKDILSITLIPVNNLVEELRSVKDEEEILNIIKATQITDDTINYAASMLDVGITEKYLAWEMERYMRDNGGDSISFEFIVASGHNSSMPHSKPTDKKININEPIILDVGTKYNGYCSDVSRTFFIGKDSDKFNELYDIVLAAQMTAFSIMEAGMSGKEADYIAREIITQYGYSDYFGHGLGHGIGLSVHELPRLNSNSKDVLLENMVYTIEPGVYIPGWGGIRIEDTVMIKNGKPVSLSKACKVHN